MTKSFKMILLISGLIGFWLTACTRASEEMKVTFTIPNLQSGIKAAGTGNSAMAVPTTAQLGHLIINVTGAGIPNPVLFTWDSCRGNCPANFVAPSTFSMTVPSGAGRLVQVLAVYIEPSNSNMYFYYGDLLADLNSANVAVNVPITQISTTKPVVQGQVSGRYISSGSGTITNGISDEVGPTGIIDISFDPGGGKQTLLVDHSTIINGWFSLFMLSGVNLKYTVRSTGEVLWGGPVGLDSTQFNMSTSALTGSQIFKAYIPVHQRANGNSMSTEPAEINVWGYWGAVSGANMKYICTSAMSGTLSSLFQASIPNSTAAPAALTIANAGGTPPTNVQLLNLAPTGAGSQATPYGSVFVEGGSTFVSTCGGFAAGAPNEYLKYQIVSSAAINGNGKEMAAGIFGMLRLNKSTAGTTNGQVGYVIPTNDTAAGNIGNLVFNILPLPGLESVMNEIKVFKKVGSSGNMNTNFVNCQDIASMGFTQANITAVPVTGNSATALAISTNITPTEAITGVDAVICPVLNGAILPMGTYVNRWSLGFGGGNNQGQLATNLKITTAQDFAAIGDPGPLHTDNVIDGACTPIFISTATSTGASAWTQNSPSVTLATSATTAPTVSFYSDNACASLITTPINIFGDQTIVYIKSSGTISAPVAFNITASTSAGTQLTAAKAYFKSNLPSTATALIAGSGLQIRTRITPNLMAFSCQRIGYELWDPSLNAITSPLNYGMTYSFTAPSSTVLNYFTSGDCTGTPLASPPVNFSGGISTYYNYVAFMNTGGNLFGSNPITPTGTTIVPIKNGDPSNNTAPVASTAFLYIPTITQPGLASSVQIMAQQSMPTASCSRIQVSAKDMNWNNTSFGVAQSITLNLALNTGTASYYADYPSCIAGTPIAGSFPATLAFGTWEFTKVVYVKNLPVGTATISTSGLNYSYTPIGAPSPVTVNISPAIQNINIY